MYNKLAIFFSFLLLFLFLSPPTFAVTLFSTDFEENSLSAWSSSGGGATATASAEAARSGTYSIKITHDKTSSYGFQTIITNIEGGMFYEGSAYGKSSDTNISSFFIRVAWYTSSDGSGSQLSSPNDSNQGSSGSDWMQLSTDSIQAPSNANSAKLRLVLTSNTSGQAAFAYFDDVVFRESIAPTSTPTNTPTPTNAPTATKTPTPTPKPTSTSTPTPSPTISPTSEVLSASESSSAAFEFEEPTAEPTIIVAGAESGISRLAFVGAGLFFLASGIMLAWKYISPKIPFIHKD